MQKFFVSLGLASALFLSGCSLSTADRAVVTANATRDVAEAEAALIQAYCVPKYQAVSKREELEAVDKVCLPARTAYLSTKVLWKTLVGVIRLAESGQAKDDEILQAVQDLAEALADLRTLVGGLK